MSIVWMQGQPGPRWRLWAPLLTGAALLFFVFAFIATHANMCHPRNLNTCAARFVGALETLDIRDQKTQDFDADPESDIGVLCPSALESIACYYWFSGRCLSHSQAGELFYAKLYLESNGAVASLCYPPNQLSILQTRAPCMRKVRLHRSECSQRFRNMIEQDNDPYIVSDSWYDDDGLGTFRAPFCRALREYLICLLHLVLLRCGDRTYAQIEEIQDNVTGLVFSLKCPSSLKPSLMDAHLYVWTWIFPPSMHLPVFHLLFYTVVLCTLLWRLCDT